MIGINVFVFWVEHVPLLSGYGSLGFGKKFIHPKTISFVSFSCE